MFAFCSSHVFLSVNNRFLCLVCILPLLMVLDLWNVSMNLNILKFNDAYQRAKLKWKYQIIHAPCKISKSQEWTIVWGASSLVLSLPLFLSPSLFHGWRSAYNEMNTRKSKEKQFGENFTASIKFFDDKIKLWFCAA